MAKATTTEESNVRIVPPTQQHLVVTQANALAQGIQDMDLYEARLVRTLIAVLDRHDNEFPTVRLYVPDLCRLFGIDNSHSVHDKLKRATKSIMTKFAFVEHGRGSWKAFNWIAVAEYVSGRDSGDGIGYVDMQLHGHLRTFLLELKRNFFSYPLRHVTQMRSQYGIRLYELLLADSLSGKRRVLQYDLDDLRKRLGAQTYKAFGDFRKNVLEVAKRECTRTNLSFEYEKILRVQRVVALEFTLTFGAAREEIALVRTDQDDEDLVQRVALQNELLAAGFSGAPGRYLDELGMQRVRHVLSRCTQDAARLAGTKNEIRNLGGYIRSQLDREIDVPTRATNRDDHGTDAGSASSRLTLAAVSRRSDELYQAWGTACAAFEADTWQALGDERQHELESVMREILTPFALRQLDAHGWRSSSPIVAAARRDAMRHDGVLEYPQHLQDLHEFVRTHALLLDLEDDDRDRVLRDAQAKYFSDT